MCKPLYLWDLNTLDLALEKSRLPGEGCIWNTVMLVKVRVDSCRPGPTAHHPADYPGPGTAWHRTGPRNVHWLSDSCVPVSDTERDSWMLPGLPWGLDGPSVLECFISRAGIPRCLPQTSFGTEGAVCGGGMACPGAWSLCLLPLCLL